MGLASHYDPSLHGVCIEDPKISPVDEYNRRIRINDESDLQTKLAPKGSPTSTARDRSELDEQAQGGSRVLLAPGHNAGPACFDVQPALPSILNTRPTRLAWECSLEPSK